LGPNRAIFAIEIGLLQPPEPSYKSEQAAGGTFLHLLLPLRRTLGVGLQWPYPTPFERQGFLDRKQTNTPKGNSIERQGRKVDNLRGALIAVERAMGVPLKDLAEKYKVSPAGVKRYLDQAEESGLVEHFRSLIYERLMGKALAVYEAKLEMGDLDAARDVVFGLGVLQKNPVKPGDMAKAIDSLAEYRASRAKVVEVRTPDA
jgi:DNA-binding Lrp family transcriptional regulator